MIDFMLTSTTATPSPEALISTSLTEDGSWKINQITCNKKRTNKTFLFQCTRERYVIGKTKRKHSIAKFGKQFHSKTNCFDKVYNCITFSWIELMHIRFSIFYGFPINWLNIFFIYTFIRHDANRIKICFLSYFKSITAQLFEML